ncbi:SDR family NAD(P)-dependent oxidoreductase [Bacillus tianshenii]|uniref:SDR family NAD(P)-dependent oxidoreductase n=1 Tax=Sutcliffiella tianshenii TaxID=1463404 RepID=UPI001CD803E0|nr:SDR family NAD(P)-dependent oxidoreductase [Bacillus tianshenii]MCA1319124.1 SDR family NAD(P)-dependent oxidoreductase [Bacillus tianshenii]
MRKALVIGASGGMGYSIVKELVSNGIEVVAFSRGAGKLEELFGKEELVAIQPGDAENAKQLIEAAQGCDVIFHALNIPYSQWKEKLLPIVKNILKAAEMSGAKLAVVDNIYAYGKSSAKLITEDKAKRPHTKKGKIRLEMEQLIFNSDVPAFIAHFPDFYGPNATNTYMHYTLNQIVWKNKAGYVGPKTIAREFLLTTDGAKAMVTLALHPKAYGQNWNIPANRTITGNELELLIKNELGEKKSLYSISKPMFAFFSLFAGKDMREGLEMQYIANEATILSGSKYENEIGPLPRTPYEEGLRETIQYMKNGKY